MTKDLIITSAATPAAPGQALARPGRFELRRTTTMTEIGMMTIFRAEVTAHLQGGENKGE
jgi:hypothetical protein